MAPLWRLSTEVLSAPHPSVGADRFLRQLHHDGEAAATLAAALPDRVLTISYSSTLARAIRLRRPAQVVCMMSEPGGEGRRLAEAIDHWTEATVSRDEDALAEMPADAVVSGADAVTPEAVVNKLKTRALMHAAADKGIPRYAVAGETKFVPIPLPIEALFEAVPLELFTALATPTAAAPPAEAASHARSTALHPLLAELARTSR